MIGPAASGLYRMHRALHGRRWAQSFGVEEGTGGAKRRK